MRVQWVDVKGDEITVYRTLHIAQCTNNELATIIDHINGATPPSDSCKCRGLLLWGLDNGHWTLHCYMRIQRHSLCSNNSLAPKYNWNLGLWTVGYLSCYEIFHNPFVHIMGFLTICRKCKGVRCGATISHAVDPKASRHHRYIYSSTTILLVFSRE
jgi:hypothetical protein